jgi:hypothetical protein
MDLKRKTFAGGWELKDETRGEVTASVASLDTPDRDGDLFARGAFRPSPVALSFWGHDTVTADAPPVGAGTISEQDGRAVFEGRFFLNTTRAREAYETLKGMGEGARWSFGFPRGTAETRDPTPAERRQGARRVYTAVFPIEASPVLVPAGHGTGTLALRSLDTEAAVRAAGVKTLKSVMAEREISHQEVADALEVDVPTVRKILTGQAPFPDLSDFLSRKETTERPTRDPEEIEASLKRLRSAFTTEYGPVSDRRGHHELRRKAEQVAAWAADRLGVPTPVVKVFEPGDAGPWGGCFMASDPGVIWLRSDQAGVHLTRAAIHETVHHALHHRGLDYRDEDVVAHRTETLLKTLSLENSPQWQMQQMQRRMASFGEPWTY